MEEYRKQIKNHFETVPSIAGMLKVDYLFWGIGIALFVLGAFLTMTMNAGIVMTGDVLMSVGTWGMLFGMVLAFIKKNDMGLLVTSAAAEVMNLILFIVLLTRGAVSVGTIISSFMYGLMFVLAYNASSAKKRSDLKNAQSAALLAQQMQTNGTVICPECGTAMPADSAFCPVCGAKAPEGAHCPQCGTVAAAGTLFCSKCGARIPAAGNKCPGCGAPINANEEFCSQCGKKLK